MVNMGENNSEEINMPVFAAFFSSNLLDSSLLQAKHNSKNNWRHDKGERIAGPNPDKSEIFKERHRKQYQDENN